MPQPQSTFLLPKLLPREGQIDRILNAIMTLPIDCAYRVEIKEAKATRSEKQNRYLWGCVYPAITAHLEGWESEDVHDWCLGEHFGWETIEGLGKKRLRPLRRSSKLSKFEFMQYIEFIQRRMAGFGIIIPDPDPEYALHRDEVEA
jgi:hypothetical protein